MPRPRKEPNEVAIKRLQEVFEDSGKTQSEFARSLTREGYKTRQQNVQRYLAGKNEIPSAFAREVARVYGVNESWLLGYSPYKTPVDESMARISHIRNKFEKRHLLFDLMAELNLWTLTQPQDVAAPIVGEGEVFDMSAIHMDRFRTFRTIRRGDTTIELDQVQVEKLVRKVADYFDFEIEHL